MTLHVNGREAEAAGSLLDAVLAAGVSLPHLCKDDNLPALGACRTCLVEADGRIVAACSVPATAAERVETATERVQRIRRGVLELTAGMIANAEGLAGGPHSGAAAAAFARAGVRAGCYAGRERGPADTTNSFFTFHEDECVLCGRCVSACQDLQHIGAIGLAGRGTKTRVTPGTALTFRESVCTSCGSCVAACPTPALRPRPGEPP